MGKTEPLMEATLLNQDCVRQPAPYFSISRHKCQNDISKRLNHSRQASHTLLNPMKPSHRGSYVTMWLGIHYVIP